MHLEAARSLSAQCDQIGSKNYEVEEFTRSTLCG